MSITTTPNLRLRTTLNHPADPAIVLGYNARDIRYGKDSLVLKGEELPDVRDGPAVTHFVVPEDQADEILDSGEGASRLYILGENFVYYIPFTVLEEAQVHTGSIHGENITGPKIAVDDCVDWIRTSVEVGN